MGTDNQIKVLGAGANKRQADRAKSLGEAWAGKEGQYVQWELRCPHVDGKLCSGADDVRYLLGTGKH